MLQLWVNVPIFVEDRLIEHRLGVNTRQGVGVSPRPPKSTRLVGSGHRAKPALLTGEGTGNRKLGKWRGADPIAPDSKWHLSSPPPAARC